MKNSKELEEERKEKLNPTLVILESIINFEPGLTVGLNPTNNEFKSIRHKNIEIAKRGVVKSIKKEYVHVRWKLRHYEQIHYSKLKIYNANDQRDDFYNTALL